MSDDLIGVGEIKNRHGISRTQVFRLIASDDWPEPVAELRHGRVWKAEDVDEAMSRLRAEGRVTADNRLIPRRFAVAVEP